jgi:dipeptidyl aminopeptidase/acylaminoacyl peptidase
MVKKLSMLLFTVAGGLMLCDRANASDAWRVAGNPGVIAQDLQFANGAVHLAGTVYLPANGNHLPAVVALHEAGTATRDAALFQHLTEGLPAMGVAVLIYDRRGSGKSTGSLNDVDYEALADDAIAGQQALATLARIDPNRIGFWGLSQGGWLAVLAAGRSKSAAFAISVSAPLVTPERQMEFATTNLLTIRGYSHRDVQEMLDARKAWIGYLKGTNSRAVAVGALQKVETKPWFGLAFMPEASTLTSDPEHSSLPRKMDDDPILAVHNVRVPLLFIYGGADPWIPVAQTVEQLQALAKQRSNIRYAVIAGASHEMMFREHETMAFDAKTFRENAPQAPSYFMLMASWLRQQIGE